MPPFSSNTHTRNHNKHTFREKGCIIQSPQVLRRKDTEIFFGKGVKPSYLNDDALARTLDKLYDANPKKVFSTLALQALMHENIDTKVLHGDTTARLLYGEYEEESDEEGLLKNNLGLQQRTPHRFKAI